MNDESDTQSVIDTIIEEMIQQHKDILNLLERMEVLEATVEKQDRQIEVLYTRVGRMDRGL